MKSNNNLLDFMYVTPCPMGTFCKPYFEINDPSDFLDSLSLFQVFHILICIWATSLFAFHFQRDDC